MDGTYTGVVDRVVDGETAVLVLEEAGEPVEQLDVPVEALPEEAREGGGILSVTVEDGAFVSATYEREATEERQERIAEKLDRLSESLSDR